MAVYDSRGARGANAGDDYHELWALRESLALLHPETRLQAVAVEGVTSTDESSGTHESWDGVDCSYYVGGTELRTVTEFSYDQVKYSTAHPERAWTVAELTASEKKSKRKRSILGRLAEAFHAVYSQRPDLVDAGRCRIRLVSNRPVSIEVITAVSALKSPPEPGVDARQDVSGPPVRKTPHDDTDLRPKPPSSRNGRSRRSAASAAISRLADAAKLPPSLQSAFFAALDLSQCGSSSRMTLEENLLREIALATAEDSRPHIDTMMRSIRQRMMPEAKRRGITRQDVLAWLGTSDESALFPCSSERPR